MEKKNLFITKKLNGLGGGPVISNRNYELFCKTFSQTDTIRYNIAKKRYTFSDSLIERCIKHYVNGVNREIISDILNIAQECEHIWIDNSSFGAIAKELKNNKYKGMVITFFHNIEYIFQKRSFLKRSLYPLFNLPIKNAEKDAAKYSDLIFVLTQRDHDIVKSWGYNTPIILLPSSMKDTYKILSEEKTENSIKEILFVGANFYANVNGITWFIDNVLPHVNVHLTIIGDQMDKLPIKSSEKITLHGRVNDLGIYYTQADCVIAPIFEGSGMKTKTTEALMWGKFIIGTKEAFCGFDITNEVGICCENNMDFIKALKDLEKRKTKYNEASRNLFLQKYSMEKSIAIFQNTIKRFHVIDYNKNHN